MGGCGFEGEGDRDRLGRPFPEVRRELIDGGRPRFVRGSILSVLFDRGADLLYYNG